MEAKFVNSFSTQFQDEARELYGTDFVPVEVIDPAKRLTIDAGKGVKKEVIDYFFFSSRRRHTISSTVSWARRCV